MGVTREQMRSLLAAYECDFGPVEDAIEALFAERDEARDALVLAVHEYLETPLCDEHTSPDYASTCGTCISWAIARVHLHSAVDAVSP